jgi:hypothetical protein
VAASPESAECIRQALEEVRQGKLLRRREISRDDNDEQPTPRTSFSRVHSAAHKSASRKRGCGGGADLRLENTRISSENAGALKKRLSARVLIDLQIIKPWYLISSGRRRERERVNVRRNTSGYRAAEFLRPVALVTAGEFFLACARCRRRRHCCRVPVDFSVASAVSRCPGPHFHLSLGRCRWSILLRHLSFRGFAVRAPPQRGIFNAQFARRAAGAEHDVRIAWRAHTALTGRVAVSSRTGGRIPTKRAPALRRVLNAYL